MLLLWGGSGTSGMAGRSIVGLMGLGITELLGLSRGPFPQGLFPLLLPVPYGVPYLHYLPDSISIEHSFVPLACSP